MQKIVRRTGAPFVAFLLLVATMLAAPAKTVTSPKQQFGHNIGDDYFLANYTQFTEYWQKLDARIRSHEARQSIGKTAEGRDQLMAIVTLARELQEARSLQGDLAAARARRRAHRRSGARAREGRQGGRLDRRRPARDRSARRAAADRDGLSAGQPQRRRDAAHSCNDVIILFVARQSRRHGARRRLVHARAGSEAAHADRRCRGSTRSTSATTTTATSTCRPSRRRRT